MIRKPFLNRYKNSPLLYTSYDKQYEDEYIINTNRPLGDKDISHIPQKKIFTFVEDLLTNPKISNVLFSSNSKNEIKHYLHSNEIIQHNTNHFCKSSTKNHPIVYNPVRQREQEKIFKMIKVDITDHHKKKFIEKKKLTAKIKKLHSILHNDMKEKRNMIDNVNTVRMNSFNRSIQRCKSHLEKSPDFKLPEVKLNLSNVYSRLHHNAIYLSRNSNNKKVMTASQSTPNIKVKKKFNLKHVIAANKGKEFISNITDDITNKCLFKHSGGPVEKVKRYINKDNDICNQEMKNKDLISLKHARDDFDNTYLHDAVLDSSIEFVRYYLQKNLNPNDQNKNGDTPLHFAMKEGNYEVIKLLIEYKGDLTIKNKRKETPYDYASSDIKREFKLEHRVN